MTLALSAMVVSSAGAASLTLAWDGSPDAQGYVVRYGPRNAPSSSQIDVGWQTTATLTNLSSSEIYCFTVYARSTGGLSDGSNQVCAIVDPPPSKPALSDFDFDNRYDLVWQHQLTGQISSWSMKGTVAVGGGLFTPGVVADTNWKIVGRADMNGDGNADLVWQNKRTGGISAWLMRGPVSVGGGLLTPGAVTDTNWEIVGVADANGDGHADLYWRNKTSGALSVWLMRGTTSVDAVSMTPDRVGDTNWQVVGVGDMNADGFPDLIWQNQQTGSISTWYMRGSLSVGSAVIGAVPDVNWKIRTVADMDGDGQTDLVWQNQANGMVSTWLMVGVQQKSGVLLTPGVVADTNWRIVR